MSFAPFKKSRSLLLTNATDTLGEALALWYPSKSVVGDDAQTEYILTGKKLPSVKVTKTWAERLAWVPCISTPEKKMKQADKLNDLVSAALEKTLDLYAENNVKEIQDDDDDEYTRIARARGMAARDYMAEMMHKRKMQVYHHWDARAGSQAPYRKTVPGRCVIMN